MSPIVERQAATFPLDRRENVLGTPWRARIADKGRFLVEITDDLGYTLARTPYSTERNLTEEKKQAILISSKFAASVLNNCAQVRGAQNGNVTVGWDYESAQHILPIFEAANTVAGVLGALKKGEDDNRPSRIAKVWWKNLKDQSWARDIARVRKGVAGINFRTELEKQIGAQAEAPFVHHITDEFNSFVTTENYKQPLIALAELFNPSIVDRMKNPPKVKALNAQIENLTRKMASLTQTSNKRDPDYKKKYKMLKEELVRAMLLRRELRQPYRDIVNETRADRVSRHEVWRRVAVESMNAFWQVMGAGLGGPHDFPDLVSALRRGRDDIHQLARLLKQDDPKSSQALKGAVTAIDAAVKCIEEPRDRNQNFISLARSQRLQKYAAERSGAVFAEPTAKALRRPLAPKSKSDCALREQLTLVPPPGPQG